MAKRISSPNVIRIVTVVLAVIVLIVGLIPWADVMEKSGPLVDKGAVKNLSLGIECTVYERPAMFKFEAPTDGYYKVTVSMDGEDSTRVYVMNRNSLRDFRNGDYNMKLFESDRAYSFPLDDGQVVYFYIPETSYGNNWADISVKITRQ